MDLKETIQGISKLETDENLSIEVRTVLTEAKKQLQKARTKEQVIAVINMLASLFEISSKFIH